MNSKVETHARIGRLYYQMLTDAEGYPNGLAHWHELPPREKYNTTVAAVCFIEYMASAGFVTKAQTIGFNNPTTGWEEGGDYKTLYDYFEQNHEKQKQEFEQRLNDIVNPFTEG